MDLGGIIITFGIYCDGIVESNSQSNTWYFAVRLLPRVARTLGTGLIGN